MISNCISWARAGVVVAVACLFMSTPLIAVEYSMSMPRAQESLLLDITRAGDRLVAVGERGHVLYSDDRGENWIQARVPTSVMLTRLYFVNEQLGWAVGHDGNVLHSRDGGLSWELQRDGVAEQAGINEARAGRALKEVEALRIAVEQAGELDAERLEEALSDAEWVLDNAREALDQPLYASPLMDVWFASPEQGWAAGAYGTLLHTANGGRDWADWSHKVGNPEELHFNGIAGDGAGGLYLASEWGVVFVSGNGGEHWQMMETGYDGSFFGVVVSPVDNRVIAYGLLGTLYASVDSGTDWSALNSGVSASLFGATVDGERVVFVGQGGTATLSSDAGRSFTPLIQPDRNGLFGVVALPDGALIATGQGGSRALLGAPGESQK